MKLTLDSLKPALLAVLMVFGVAFECSRAEAAGSKTAIFAGGCFWCVESDFEQVKGVREVVSGFTGGRVKNPTYRQVSKGGTGHFEAAMIQYDPAVVSYERLLYYFFRSVDPLDAGGQFCDRGDEYRTAIFVSNAQERAWAEAAKAKAEKELGKTIVTPILDAAKFYPARDYHQDYYKKDEVVITRRGPKTKEAAYKFYRKSCGRDKRVKQLWGKDAHFAQAH